MKLVAVAGVAACLAAHGHGELRLRLEPEIRSAVAVGPSCDWGSNERGNVSRCMLLFHHALLRGNNDIQARLDASAIRGRSDGAALARAEYDHWRGRAIGANLARQTGPGQASYVARLVLGAVIARGREVDLGLVGRALRTVEQPMGPFDRLRTSALVSAANPTIGRTHALAAFRAGVRAGSRTAAARALMLVAAVEHGLGRRRRAEVLSTRSARIAALHADGTTAAASIAQVAELVRPTSAMPAGACGLVDLRQSAALTDCRLSVIESAWRSADVHRVLELAAQDEVRKRSLAPYERLRYALAVGPALVAVGLVEGVRQPRRQRNRRCQKPGS